MTSWSSKGNKNPSFILTHKTYIHLSLIHFILQQVKQLSKPSELRSCSSLSGPCVPSASHLQWEGGFLFCWGHSPVLFMPRLLTPVTVPGTHWRNYVKTQSKDCSLVKPSSSTLAKWISLYLLFSKSVSTYKGRAFYCCRRLPWSVRNLHAMDVFFAVNLSSQTFKLMTSTD